MKKHFFLILIVVFCCFLLSTGITAVAANRGRSVPAGQLPNELKRTDIKDYYAGSGTKQIGSIQTVIGHVVVARENMRSAYHAAPGDRLFEKDVIFTLKGSKCRFKLTGEDVVTMGENTRIGVKSFNENPRRSTKSSVFTMAKGKAMFYALRLFKHRSNAMVVETPTAVSGVRGTKWGVDVVELAGKEMASLPAPIQLADTSDMGLRILAQANPPSLPQFQTTILCFSGTVFTGSTAPPPPGAPPPPVVTLSQGQMTTVGSGQPPAPPSITPPSLANSFTAGTFAPPPGDSGAPPPPPPPPGSTLIPTTGGITAFTTPDTSSLTQQQSQQTPSRPTTHYGFFSGMPSYYDTSSGQWNMEYIVGILMSSSLQNFDSGTAKAVSGSNYIEGSGFQSGSISTVFYNGVGTATGTATKTELDYNPYIEWGYWTQPTTINISGTDFRFDNRGYYVAGDYTKTMPSTISGTYTGTSAGTVWTASGGTHYTGGTFSMNVTFSGGSGSISNFVLWLNGADSSGTGGASGSISGNTYTVSGSGKAAGVGGSFSGIGSFYGPNAEATAGVWKVLASGYYVNGMYVGKK